MKALSKFCKSGKQNQRVFKRLNHSEAKDYVYHIKAGNIIGVDPSEVDKCPVCSQILQEMWDGNAQLMTSNVRANKDELTPEVLVAIWLQRHNKPGHLRSEQSMDYST